MKYIIMADGKGTRWQNYNDIPKHFIEIGGETLLARTVRLLNEGDEAADVIITSHDPRYEVPGARRYEPLNNHLEIDRFTEELIGDDVCFLYGDTYYSQEAMDTILKTETEDMIFFGNDHSDCGSVTYLNAPDKRVMYVDFRRIPNNVSMMVVLFSIYGKNPTHLFDKISDGEVSILCKNGVHMHLPITDNIHQRTLLAVAFERTEGIWEMIPSGKGIGLSLEEICRGYGVTIV